MRAQEFTLTKLEQSLLACCNSSWTLDEDANGIQILRSSLFNASLADKLSRNAGLQDKISEFLNFKKSNPGMPWGGNDAPFISAGPIGRALPKLKHAHLTRDISLFYSVEGRDPTVIKLYGVFDHRDSGTGTPSNINKQKSLAKKLSTQQFNEETLDEGWKETVAALGLVGAAAGGVAVDDYINQKNQTVPAVTAQASSPTPKIEIPNAIAKTDVKKSDITSLPPEKILATVAKASGIMGNELAQLLAQASHETLNFKHMAELGSSKYFAKKYDPKFAPKKAKALGNTQVGDGERYKGRGFLQITGRYNYTQAGKALGLPLEQHPELMERPDVAAKAAVWYWNNRVAPKVDNFSSNTAVKQVTKAINPGMKHIKQRQEKLKQYKTTKI